MQTVVRKKGNEMIDFINSGLKKSDFVKREAHYKVCDACAVVLLDGNKSRLRDKRETDTHCRYCGGSGLNINSNQAMPNCAWCNGTGDAFDQE